MAAKAAARATKLAEAAAGTAALFGGMLGPGAGAGSATGPADGGELTWLWGDGALALGAAEFFVGAGAGAILAGAGAGVVVAGVGAMVGANLGTRFAGAGAGASSGLGDGAVAAKAVTARTAKRMAERAEREADIVAAKCRSLRRAEAAGSGRVGVAWFVCALSELVAFSAGFEGGEEMHYVVLEKRRGSNDAYDYFAAVKLEWDYGSGKDGLNCVMRFRQNHIKLLPHLRRVLYRIKTHF